MAFELKQKVGEYATVMGWYGKCGDALCDPLDLTTQRDIIHQVFQWSDDEKTVKSFVSDAPDSLNDFSALECGKAYLIYLKPSLSINSSSTLILDHFTSSSFEAGNLGGVSAECSNEAIATTLSVAVEANSDRLEIPEEVSEELTNAFIASGGMGIIDEGKPNAEMFRTTESGSFVLAAPLKYNHDQFAKIGSVPLSNLQGDEAPADPADGFTKATMTDVVEDFSNSLAIYQDNLDPFFTVTGVAGVIDGVFKPVKSEYIEWVADKNGALDAISLLVSNKFNTPSYSDTSVNFTGSKIRGYVYEVGTDPAITKDNIRWELTFEDIETALNDSSKKQTLNFSKDGGTTIDYAWVDIDIKCNSGFAMQQKKGASYVMRVDEFINCSFNGFGPFATMKKNSVLSGKTSWGYSSFFSGATNPILKTKVGCHATYTCADTVSTMEVSSDVWAPEDDCNVNFAKTVEIDDKNGSVPFGGLYKYQGTMTKKVLNENLDGIIPQENTHYYFRSAEISSFMEDWSVITVTGSTLRNPTSSNPAATLPASGTYKKDGSSFKYTAVSGSGILERVSDDAGGYKWVIYKESSTLSFRFESNNAQVEQLSSGEVNWGSHDIKIVNGQGSAKDYILYHKGRQWIVSEFSQAKEDADQVSGLDVAYTNEQVGTSGIIDLSNELMCMQTFAENMATQGKVPLASSRYPNTEMIVDPSGLPQGPSGGSPLEASNGFLSLFESDNYCIYVADNGDLRFNSDNLRINVEDNGFLKSSTAISTGTSAFDLYNKYPQSFYSDMLYANKEETSISMYLVKPSFFTEIGTNAPLSEMYKLESGDITIDSEHYVPVQMEAHDGSYLSYLWNLKKMVNDDGVDFKLTSNFGSFDDFNTWVNDSALYIIGYVYNNSDVNPGYGGVGNPYHDVGLFTFGGAEPVMYCNDGETASYAEGEYPTQTPLAVNLPSQMWITETGDKNLGFTGIYVRASEDYNFTSEGLTMPYYRQENGAFAMRYNDANARWEFGDDLIETDLSQFMGSYNIYGDTLDSMSDMDVSLTEPSDWNAGGGNSGGGDSGGGAQGPTGDGLTIDDSWVGTFSIVDYGSMAPDMDSCELSDSSNILGDYEYVDYVLDTGTRSFPDGTSAPYIDRIEYRFEHTASNYKISIIRKNDISQYVGDDFDIDFKDKTMYTDYEIMMSEGTDWETSDGVDPFNFPSDLRIPNDGSQMSLNVNTYCYLWLKYEDAQ